ncbi:Zinc finger protein ZIC 2, partial [Dipsacomyces acuminosporus]
MTPSDIDATAAPAAGNPHREDKDRGRDRDKGAAAVDSANTAASKVQCAWAECTAEFGSMHMLAAHLSNTHIASEQGSDNTCHWHACPHNSTPFSSRYDLVTHLKRHTGNRSFLCPYDGCGKVYKRVDFLSKHINTHSAANNNAGNARAQLSIPGRQVRRARQKAAAAEYRAVDVISDTDSSSSEDAPLALISASKKRKKTNPCSSDNDNDNDATARASSNPYRYRTGSN